MIVLTRVISKELGHLANVAEHAIHVASVMQFTSCAAVTAILRFVKSAATIEFRKSKGGKLGLEA